MDVYIIIDNSDRVFAFLLGENPFLQREEERRSLNKGYQAASTDDLGYVGEGTVGGEKRAFDFFFFFFEAGRGSGRERISSRLSAELGA